MLRLHHSRASRFVAAFLLFASLLGSPHGRQDDAACIPVSASEHDASKHAVAAFDAAHPDHCAVCHWLRGLKPSFAAAFGGGGDLSLSDAVAAATATVHRCTSSAPLAARAPPSTL
jgi:mono/diheme cytochrome c family protein